MEFNISKYLEKFKQITLSKSFLRDSVHITIKEVCGVDIEPSKIDIKNYIVRINEKPVIKTEIFLKKQKILEKLDKKTKGKIKEII